MYRGKHMIDEIALRVLEKRYLARDEAGTPVESVEDMFRRVADHVAGSDGSCDRASRRKISDTYFQMMHDLEFLPNSPTLMNAGRDLGQLAACFVLPVEDSLDSIFESVKETAKIHQSGGGTGFSFSRLRPKGDIVRSTMGAASGPVSFIRVFNMATEVIKQGGTRRGANMGILRIDHPDIEEFVTIKNDPCELTNFNLSVAVTDKFFQSCYRNELFSLINPRNGQVVRKIEALNLMGLIARCAWETGEPGLVYIDTVNRSNPTPHLGPIEATNPCGEQPLLPYESCCLGSIDCAKVVREGRIDYDRLKALVHHAVRFLDDTIDAGRYPIQAIRDISRANRKIGLGVMGFAHMLIKLDIPYDSGQAVTAARDLMSFIDNESKAASRGLAAERGVFPNYRGSTWEKKGIPLRNATTTTIAPTGTLSILAGTSSGIEPIYDIEYSRILFGGLRVNVIDPLYKELQGTLDPGRLEGLFRKAYDVSPEWHCAIQKAFQDHVDNAVSKTINLNARATPQDIESIYMKAHEMGLKGITVFRDTSRDAQILSCRTQQTC
ncbi:MAG: ribonucleoside-diphosphate reductase alpha chain [Deltaproteobacteria bacterium]|nr:ribonucleoside-diphosphate reductase alpha chain [Deltaproteobacteria bacterium]